jgi:hypothetical protein
MGMGIAMTMAMAMAMGTERGWRATISALPKSEPNSESQEPPAELSKK